MVQEETGYIVVAQSIITGVPPDGLGLWVEAKDTLGFRPDPNYLVGILQQSVDSAR
jgi:hypothetical protein